MIIYQITNIVNGKSYIGKSIKTAEQRLKKHLYNANSGGDTFLYKAIRKYGHESFKIEVIECLQEDCEQTLNKREKFWISQLSPEYNMTEGGDGGRTSDSPNFRIGMAKYHANKCKQSYATRGMTGKKQSKKFLNSISKANSVPVMCEGKLYPSLKEASNYYPGICLRKRLDNPKHPEFYRLRKIIRRKS